MYVCMWGEKAQAIQTFDKVLKAAAALDKNSPPRLFREPFYACIPASLCRNVLALLVQKYKY